MSTESVMLSNHLIPCSPSSPLAISLPQHQGLFNEWALCIRWWKYWSFSFNISPSSEYSTSVFPGLIFFRTDWFDFSEVQRTLKSLLQHHNLKASILWCSAFFIVQFSHPYMTTGKTIPLTIQTIVSKVMSLFFNILSSFVKAFPPRSKHFFKFGGCIHCPQWFWSPRK